ncbi:MAG: hypothetical protein WC822_06090 [Candidatus Paceibacterota bacterium]|jgi:hypothetical protein
MGLIDFNTKTGELFVQAGKQEVVNRLIWQALHSDDMKAHSLLAQRILGPIKKVADYEEWTTGLLVSQPYSLGEVVRVALDSPTVIAFFTSGSVGLPNFSRPGRKFDTVSVDAYDAGVEVGWYDQPLAGWNVLSQKIKEAGEELSRKRDYIRKTAIDTAVAAQTGHTSTVATEMTKASVDAIIKAAALVGFPITNVRINPGTMMDMTGWTWPSNSMWNRLGPERAEQVIKQGFVTAYGGAEWMAKRSVPTDYVYFFSAPELTGFEFPITNTPGPKTAISLANKSDQYLYEEWLGVYVKAHAMWRLQIT